MEDMSLQRDAHVRHTWEFFSSISRNLQKFPFYKLTLGRAETFPTSLRLLRQTDFPARLLCDWERLLPLWL